jgi:hypothetical protein
MFKPPREESNSGHGTQLACDGRKDTAGFSTVLFMAQIIIAPVVCFVLGLVATIAFEFAFRTHDNTILSYIAFAGQGLLLGYMVQQKSPTALISGGRWTWILPLAHLGFWIHKATITEVLNFFVLTKPGLAGIELFFFTLPAVASVFYSVGIALAARSRARNP